MIPDKLTLLAFNSLQFNDLNTHKSIHEKLNELEWLKEQLNNAGENEKFIIEMHIYETADWWGKYGAAANWHEDEYQTMFVNLMK